MLGLADYTAAAAELRRLAQRTEEATIEGIEGATKKQATKIALDLAEEYTDQYHTLLNGTMHQVVDNALVHYDKKLGGVLAGDDEREQIRKRLVQEVLYEPYYGQPLVRRLIYNENGLTNRVHRSGQVDPKWLGTVYTQTPMFGSQLAIDQRLLLATLLKLEQDVAREMATRTKHRLLRWTLSHRHRQKDQCDDLAENVDRTVVHYLTDNRLDMNPKGLYFVEDLPHPPHPNCQCEWNIVTDFRESEIGRLERTVEKMKDLLRKLWGL